MLLKRLHLSLKHLHQLLKSLLPLQSLKRLLLHLHLWLLRHQLLKLLLQLLLLWKHQQLRLRLLLKHQATPHHAVSFQVLAPRRPLQRGPFLPTVHLLWHVRQAHCHQACRQVCHHVEVDALFHHHRGLVRCRPLEKSFLHLLVLHVPLLQ